MIDPFTAMAAVTSAVNMIKKAASTVEDVRSLGPLLGKYFDAKHQATKAVRESKKAGGSNMAKAIEIELALKQQEDFENDLKELFIYSGHADTWSKIIQRTQEMNRADIEEERAEKDRALRRKKQADEIADILTALFAVGAFLSVLLFIVYQAVN